MTEAMIDELQKIALSPSEIELSKEFIIPKPHLQDHYEQKSIFMQSFLTGYKHIKPKLKYYP